MEGRKNTSSRGARSVLLNCGERVRKENSENKNDQVPFVWKEKSGNQEDRISLQSFLPRISSKGVQSGTCRRGRGRNRESLLKRGGKHEGEGTLLTGK